MRGALRGKQGARESGGIELYRQGSSSHLGSNSQPSNSSSPIERLRDATLILWNQQQSLSFVKLEGRKDETIPSRKQLLFGVRVQEDEPCWTGSCFRAIGDVSQ